MPNVSAELYEVISLAMRYVFAFLGVLIVLRSFRLMLADRRANRSLLRKLPDAGTVGELMVLRGSSELPENTCLPVGREGVLGSVRGCDLFIPCPGVRRSHLDFIWEDGHGLLLLPRRGCGVAVNGTVLDSRSDPRQLPLSHGGILAVGDAVLRLHVFTGLQTAPQGTENPMPESAFFREAGGACQAPFPPAAAQPVPQVQPQAQGAPWGSPQEMPVPPEQQLPSPPSPGIPEAYAPASSGRVRRSDRWKEDWSE